MTRLVEASMTLRGESPVGWKLFCEAMQEYAYQITDQMVKCPPELLQRAQGMALQANEIAGVINDAPKLFEKLQAARMGKKNGQETRSGY